VKRKRKKQVDEIEKEYKTKIRFKCPKRGWVEEEITVKRYKAKEVDEETYGYSFLEEEAATPEE
jgi:succinate dehydrogenase flavin-adding protein (antitoxin of CptAB toxin-antitoxin module)